MSPVLVYVNKSILNLKKIMTREVDTKIKPFHNIIYLDLSFDVQRFEDENN